MSTEELISKLKLGSALDETQVENPSTRRALIDLLQHVDLTISCAAATALANLKIAEGIEAIIDIIRDGNISEDHEQCLVLALSHFRELAIPQLIEYLKTDKNIRVRKWIIEILAIVYETGIYGERILDILIVSLDDHELEMYVLQAFATLKDRRFLNSIDVAKYIADPSRDVNTKAALIWALGNLREIGYLPLIAGLLNNNEKPLRINAIYTLGQLGDQNTSDMLIPLLEDQDIDIVKSAVLALGNLGNKNAIPYLLRLEQFLPKSRQGVMLGTLIRKNLTKIGDNTTTN